MNRLQARKIALIAYKEIKTVIDKWNVGVINWLPIDFHFSGEITVGEEVFSEYELIGDLEDDE